MFDNNYSKYYDLFNSNKPYKKEIQFVYKWAEKPTWIFDIGAGTASYWKYYPKDCYILGIEKSQEMIELAKHPKSIFCEDIMTYQHCESLHGRFGCVTALFDVMNYIPKHDWWKNLPLDRGGYFIFDIWDKEKVDKDGFQLSFKMKDGVSRTIIPIKYDGKKVDLEIEVVGKDLEFKEKHTMYLYSQADIKKFCGDEFEIVEVKPTKKWQTWIKLKRR